ncbi:MAG: ParA family protein [Candidatus Hydrogenedentes bacterium]|nr:ParA family protein [Candidatus Hydrogenedentota bacterium]
MQEQGFFMPQVISVINMKGGVGKTTIAVNVAYALAEKHRKKVLLVDVDPQFNASTCLMKSEDYLRHVKDPSKHTIVDIFRPPGGVHFSTVSSGRRGKQPSKPTLESATVAVFKGKTIGQLDLLPSHLSLMAAQDAERGTENRLRNFLQKCADDYDYVLIDCPPTISIYTQSAILASEKYWVPIKPDPLSTIGLPLLEQWLEDFTDNAGIEVDLVGIVFTMVRENTKQMLRIMEELKHKRRNDIFNATLGESISISESVEENQTIYNYRKSKNQKWANQILEIASEFLERTSGD